MADYAITFARSARKELEDLPADIAGRVLGRIEVLAGNPRLPGVIKLQGSRNLWRLRVGDYSVVYSINDFSRTDDVAVVRHRRDVYRNL